MLQEILNDRTSGSSVLLAKTLAFLESMLASGEALPEGTLERLMRVHCGMACFIHLYRFFSKSGLSEGSLNEFRYRIILEEKIMLESFRSSFPPEVNRVTVYSYSGMVLKTLAALNRPLKVDVALCGPDGEGRAMAKAVAGIPGVTPCLWADGPYFSRVMETEALVLGCDAISPGWFVNRSGTRGLVSLAMAVPIPVFLAVGPLKLLTDDELVRLPMKQGVGLPNEGADDVDWQNPLLEVVGTEGIIVTGMT